MFRLIPIFMVLMAIMLATLSYAWIDDDDDAVQRCYDGKGVDYKPIDCKNNKDGCYKTFDCSLYNVKGCGKCPESVLKDRECKCVGCIGDLCNADHEHANIGVAKCFTGEGTDFKPTRCLWGIADGCKKTICIDKKVEKISRNCGKCWPFGGNDVHCNCFDCTDNLCNGATRTGWSSFMMIWANIIGVAAFLATWSMLLVTIGIGI